MNNHTSYHEISTAIAAGLGLSMSGAEFLGGLFLALAGALFVNVIIERGVVTGLKPLGIGGTIVGGFFTAVIFSIAGHAMLPDVPPQAFMAAGGFTANIAGPFFLRNLRRLSRRDDYGEKLIDKVLPGRDDE